VIFGVLVLAGYFDFVSPVNSKKKGGGRDICHVTLARWVGKRSKNVSPSEVRSAMSSIREEHPLKSVVLSSEPGPF
jgi:hypothetical protein